MRHLTRLVRLPSREHIKARIRALKMVPKSFLSGNRRSHYITAAPSPRGPLRSPVALRWRSFVAELWLKYGT